jgi:hypothetical protein
MLNNNTVAENISFLTEYDLKMRHVNERMYFYICYGIIIPCFFLNSLTSVIFYFGPQFWKNGNRMGFYMIVQASTGNVMILFKLVFYLVHGYDIHEKEVITRLRTSISVTLLLFSGLFQFMMTIDRYINIKYTNERNQIFKNKKIVSLYSLFIFLLSLVFGIISSFGYSIQNYYYLDKETLEIKVIIYRSNRKTLGLIMTVYYFIIRLVPMAPIFILNTLLIISLVKSKLRLKLTRSLRREYLFGITLMSMNILYLIMSVPFVSMFVISNLNRDFYYLMYEDFTVWTMYLYESFHFLYNILFNKMFRNEIKNISNYLFVFKK